MICSTEESWCGTALANPIKLGRRAGHCRRPGQVVKQTRNSPLSMFSLPDYIIYDTLLS